LKFIAEREKMDASYYLEKKLLFHWAYGKAIIGSHRKLHIQNKSAGKIYGDCSKIYGTLLNGYDLVGDVSNIIGDITEVEGNATGLSGNTMMLVRKGFLIVGD